MATQPNPILQERRVALFYNNGQRSGIRNWDRKMASSSASMKDPIVLANKPAVEYLASVLKKMTDRIEGAGLNPRSLYKIF